MIAILFEIQEKMESTLPRNWPLFSPTLVLIKLIGKDEIRFLAGLGSFNFVPRWMVL